MGKRSAYAMHVCGQKYSHDARVVVVKARLFAHYTFHLLTENEQQLSSGVQTQIWYDLQFAEGEIHR